MKNGDLRIGRSNVPRFVVQKHDSKTLHYDFRLEMHGALKSWAVPKGPPEEEKLRRLAVMVEDHDIDYIDFEGEIPDGYGAGKVEIWDRGDYELEEETPGEKIVFVLYGSRLSGRYALVRMKGKGEKNWLIRKMEDQSGISD